MRTTNLNTRNLRLNVNNIMLCNIMNTEGFGVFRNVETINR